VFLFLDVDLPLVMLPLAVPGNLTCSFSSSVIVDFAGGGGGVVSISH
jgi:hypothetical protein